MSEIRPSPSVSTSTSDPSPYPSSRTSLNAFLAELRAKGIPVGPGEVAWLRHAFNLELSLERENLRELLACTLIKSRDQREIFDLAFEEWCPEEESAGEQDSTAREQPKTGQAPTQQPEPSPQKTAPDQPREKKLELKPPVADKRKRRSRWRLPSTYLSRRHALLIIVSILGVLAVLWLGSETPAISLLLRLWNALVNLDPGVLYPGAWESLVLALGVTAWCLAIVLWQRYEKRNELPPAEPPGEGPRWLPLLELENTGAVMLDADQRRALVWGVGHFVSEDLTTDLDLKATVAATARAGGIPSIRYRPAVYPREVWLWQDDSVEDSALERLVGELRTSLARAGLPVRVGIFADVPDPIEWQDGEAFSPLVLEGHRQNSLVAVLTDGVGMGITSQDELDSRPLRNLLHRFAEWPKLVFVDFGRERRGLAALLRPYGLRCIAPEDLPAFLGAEQVRAMTIRPAQELRGELRAWAAACALSPDPVDDLTAHELRRALGLSISPWRFRDLAEQAQDLGDRLGWSEKQRAKLLNWMAEAEMPAAGSGIADGSLLEKALEYWCGRYRAEAARRERQEEATRDADGKRGLPWLGTPAAQNLALEEATLELWRNPESAAKTLFELCEVDPRKGGLGGKIRARLVCLASREYRYLAEQHAEMTFLPWEWRQQSDRTRALLGAMGFAEDIVKAPEAMRAPGTLALAIGLSLGVAAASLMASGGIGGVVLGVLTIATVVMMRRDLRRKEIPEVPPEPVERIRVVEDIPGMLEMIELPGGTFLMGSPDSDDQAYDFEKPQHEVTVSDFCLSKHPVTRALYREITGEAPSDWSSDEDDDQLPANYVSWHDAVQFCNALSKRQDLRPCYRRFWFIRTWVSWDRKADGYRLPTEGEWEYAARAGTTTRWFFGDEDADLGRYGWYDKNSENRVHPVGEKEPNPWGFQDIIGNVWEWCWDRYGNYSPESVVDPMGPENGGDRVVRGGSSWGDPRNLRSASRRRRRPTRRVDVIGCRVVRAARRQP